MSDSVPADATPPPRRRFGTARMEAFSDGVFAIAITLLVLDLALPSSGSPLERVLDAWPFYLAYVVSFLTVGAAWLAHNSMTDRLELVDSVFLRLNLLVLLAVSVLPFPTRLVAESIDDLSGERVFVAMYGLTLMAIRILLTTLDAYARRESLYDAEPSDVGRDRVDARRTTRDAVIAYSIAILVGLVLPVVAVAFYCLIAVALVVPLRELKALLFRS